MELVRRLEPQASLSKAAQPQDWLSKAAKPGANLLGFGLHDTGNSQRIVELFGHNLRYLSERKKWLLWNGRRWSIDVRQEVLGVAIFTMGQFLRDAIRNGGDELIKFARKSLNKRDLESALYLAQHKLAISPTELDKNPSLLNFQNGTVDLRERSFRSHRREDFITKMILCDFDPDAQCPQWLELLTFMMDGQQHLVDYLQRCFGYSLTGSTREKAIFILFGPTGTGKTTMLTTFREALGSDYATIIQIATLLAGNENNATNADTADLCGVRFAMSSEPDPGARLSPSKLKRLTQGTGTIKARRLYENPFAFEETHKLWIDCNDRPSIPNGDQATFARLHAIPCLRQIPQNKLDRGFIEKLRQEIVGILAWSVKGARTWHDQGLSRPREISDAVATWREECDHVQQFVSEHCEIGSEYVLNAASIYMVYGHWCTGRGEEALTLTAFGTRLGQQFAKKRESDGIYYLGLTIKGSTFLNLACLSIPKNQ
jgi:putative DNA primase/helicase